MDNLPSCLPDFDYTPMLRWLVNIDDIPPNKRIMGGNYQTHTMTFSYVFFARTVSYLTPVPGPIAKTDKRIIK